MSEIPCVAVIRAPEPEGSCNTKSGMVLTASSARGKFQDKFLQTLTVLYRHRWKFDTK